MIQLKDLTLGYEQRTLLEKSLRPHHGRDNSSHCSAETAQEKYTAACRHGTGKAPKTERDYPARE